MQAIQLSIDNSDLSERDSVITVFNPTPFSRSEVISLFIDLPENMGYDAFSIQTPQGKKAAVQIKNSFPYGTLVRNLQDISLELKSERIHCHFETEDIPAFGYKTYHLVREGKADSIDGNLLSEPNTLENEYLVARFNSNGTIDLTHKETGHTYKGLHYLEDTGEIGHSWVHKKPVQNKTLTSNEFPCKIICEQDGPLLAVIRVDYHMRIPKGVEDKMAINDREEMKPDTSRTEEVNEMVVSSRFTLRKGARRLDVTTSLTNTCENHRLRVVFPTNLKTDQTQAEVSFDVVSRDIHVKEDNAYYGKENPTYPMYRFVDMTDGNKGFAVLNTGIREYEAMDTAERPLAITLFRAFTYRNTPVIGRYEVYPEMELAQCPGKHEWTYAIYPHPGDWQNGVYKEAEKLNLHLETAQAGPHKGTLPKEQSFFELSGDNLQISAFKQAQDRPGNYVARIFNPTEKRVNGTLKFARQIKNAWLVNLNEERMEALSSEGKTIKLHIDKKKIVTIEFELD